MKSGALASAALLLYLVSKPLWQFLKLLLLKRLPSSHTRYIPARVSPKSLNLFITSSQGKIEHNVHNVTLVDPVTLFNLTRSISQILVDLWRRGKNVVIARFRDKMIFYFFMTKLLIRSFPLQSSPQFRSCLFGSSTSFPQSSPSVHHHPFPHHLIGHHHQHYHHQASWGTANWVPQCNVSLRKVANITISQWQRHHYWQWWYLF